MKFVLDEDLPRSLGESLRELGHVVLDIRDHGFRGSPDSTNFQFTQKARADLLSADLDFASILRFPLHKHYGIIILRFPNTLSVRYINKFAVSAIKLLDKKDLRSTLVIISPRVIRLRKRSSLFVTLEILNRFLEPLFKRDCIFPE